MTLIIKYLCSDGTFSAKERNELTCFRTTTIIRANKRTTFEIDLLSSDCNSPVSNMTKNPPVTTKKTTMMKMMETFLKIIMTKTPIERTKKNKTNKRIQKLEQ